MNSLHKELFQSINFFKYVLYMRPFKIAINDPEESELIQEILFKLGYKWANGETKPLYCFDMKHLYLDTHITFSSDINFGVLCFHKNTRDHF